MKKNRAAAAAAAAAPAMGEMDSENTDLYHAILAWEDTEKSNTEEPLMEDGETFKEIQEMI